MRLLIVTIALMLLAGCGTSPVSPDQADRVPADSIYAFKNKSSSNDARIVFTRDSGGMSCMAIDMQLSIDGIKAASVGLGETVTLYHPPGETIISVGNYTLCGGSDETMLDLKPGYSYQLRGSRGLAGDPHIRPSGKPPYPYNPPPK